MSVIVQNLSKNYGTQAAVKNINFTVNKGEIVGFLGPNGAGKSTTMKIIAGFLQSSAGNVIVNDNLVAVDNLMTKRKIGYLPENNPLYLDMYVEEFLYFMAGIFGIQSKEKVNLVIEKVGLKAEKHKKIEQLSKGYRQRVGLAHALIHDPDVLILDEPTTGLDPNQLVEIRSLIKDIGKDKTVILSTHVMQEVEAVCDRAIIISKGEIVADDTLENLKKEGKSLEEIFRNLTN